MLNSSQDRQAALMYWLLSLPAVLTITVSQVWAASLHGSTLRCGGYKSQLG